MNSFTIKDLENLSGIKAHTIRIWEQRYKFLKPCRTCTNIRYYSNDELKKILTISLLNKYGYKISYIDKMEEHEIKETVFALTNIQAHQDKVINNLIQHMVDLDITGLENIVDRYIAIEGIERAITQILFPFLERIGILWLTNNINPAQEHLVTNIIRQKLIVGIESIKLLKKADKSVLLFLPEGEHHELGLLFAYYLLKQRGIEAFYLGANIPLADVEYIIKCKNPHYLFCHLTCVGDNFNFDKFIQACTNKFSGKPLFISGRLTNNYQKKLPANIHFKKSLVDVMGFFETI